MAAVSSVMRVRLPTVITDALDAVGSGAAGRSRVQRAAVGSGTGAEDGGGSRAACRRSAERACCRCDHTCCDHTYHRCTYCQCC